MVLSAACNQKTLPPHPAGVIPNDYTHTLRIGNQILKVEIAKDPAAMQQGLSGRASMDNNQGMLFDFGSGAPQTPQFWMKDMKFNLDFIWLYKNKIIGITPDVPAPTNNNPLPLYSPPAPIDQALEVNAGWSRAHGIKVGDEARLNEK